MITPKHCSRFWALAVLTWIAALSQPFFVRAQTGSCSAHLSVRQISRVQDSYGATFKYAIHATSDATNATVFFKIRRTFDLNGSPYSQAEPWSIVVLGGVGDDEGEVRESSSPRQIAWSEILPEATLVRPAMP
jgi:hypothetical protein